MLWRTEGRLRGDAVHASPELRAADVPVLPLPPLGSRFWALNDEVSDDELAELERDEPASVASPPSRPSQVLLEDFVLKALRDSVPSGGKRTAAPVPVPP